MTARMVGRAGQLVGRLRARRSGSNGPSSSAVAVRLVAAAAGWGALLLALPSPVSDHPVVVVPVAAVLAVAAVLLPRRHTALVLELGVVALWLLPGGRPVPTAAGAVVVALLLYLHHTAIAMAAAIGWDVRMTRSLMRTWSVRTAVVVVTASAVSVVMLVVARPGTESWPDAVLLVGVAAAVLAVAVPLASLRRPGRAAGTAGPGAVDGAGDVSGRVDRTLD